MDAPIVLVGYIMRGEILRKEPANHDIGTQPGNLRSHLHSSLDRSVLCRKCLESTRGIDGDSRVCAKWPISTGQI